MAFHLHWIELCMFESDLAELHHTSWQSWGTHCLHWLMQNFPCPLVPVKLLVLTLAQHLLDISGLYGVGWNALAPTWQSLCSCSWHVLRFPVVMWRLLVLLSASLSCTWTRIFWRLKSSFFFSCAVHMDVMLAWSHLQVSTFMPGLSLLLGLLL